MNIRDALTQACASLPESDSPRLDAELLLASVLQQRREYLYTWPERDLSEEQESAFSLLLRRRVAGEPLAYLTGTREFWSLELEVSPGVLIPRPETEGLVELALELLPEHRLRVADLGTGSGAIALALAAERPQWQFIAADVSDSALQVADSNRARLGLENVRVVKSDWCLAVEGPLDAIISNPPYIESDDPHLMLGDVRFEPKLALISGRTGLESISQIVQQARTRLNHGGWLLLEHGYTQKHAVQELMSDNGFEQIMTRPDLAGLDRISAGLKPPLDRVPL